MRRTFAILLIAGSIAYEASAAAAPPAEAAAESLQLEHVRESLTGKHYRYRRVVDGVPLLDEIVVTREPLPERRAARQSVPRGVFGLRDGARIRRVREVVTVDALGRPVAQVRDVVTGALLRETPLYFETKGGARVGASAGRGRAPFRTTPSAGGKTARVFDPNPVATLDDPSLRDMNDAAAAVPESAYRTVELPENDVLSGPHAKIVDVQSPRIPPADPAGPLLFDRSQSGFEDVNAWYHVDRNQRHLQRLGYDGARQIAPYAVEIDTHAANGTDVSFFAPTPGAPGRGTLHFGTGGTDDAEDADLVVHEYGHAILEWIAPGTFAGTYDSQARALAEAFTDYWAFSAHYAQRHASGRDPFCLADWDARCWEDDPSQNCGYAPGSDCLRRLDEWRGMVEYDTANTPGTEHWNAQIFTFALIDLFLTNVERYGLTEGRTVTDRLIVEALFETPPSPRFETIARQLTRADALLHAGRHGAAICNAMSKVGIAGGCERLPRGDVTIHPSPQRGTAIPDGDPRGIESSLEVTAPSRVESVMVRVEIAHPSRGDLRIELIAPDGTTVLLQQPSLDADRDIRATYGRDVAPAESFDVLSGRAVSGVWRLRIADTRFRDAGVLESWSLIFAHPASDPDERPPSRGDELVFPVVAHLDGADGNAFRSEVRLLNPRADAQTATLVFTPSGVDGRETFGFVHMTIAPGQLVVIDDVVRSVFGTSGSGALIVHGQVVGSSRTYALRADGTVAGQGIGPATSRNETLLAGIASNADFRTNVGITGLDGVADVEIAIREPGAERDLHVLRVTVPRHGHVQVRLPRFDSSPASDRLTVSVKSYEPVYAYASVISNATGDPRYVEQMRSLIVPAISAEGANGTSWTTDVSAIKVGPAPPEWPISFIDGRSGAVIERPGPAPIVNAVTMKDAVRETFGAPGGVGLIETSAKNYWLSATITSNGFSETLPSLWPKFLVAYLVHVESTPRHRTNIGIFSERGARVRMTLHDSAGSVLSVWNLDLLPMRLLQVPVAPHVTGGYVKAAVEHGDVYAYSSVVDNATGDATVVALQARYD